MAVPGTGEPNLAPWLQFKLDNVVALSPPPNPTNVVQAGQQISLKVSLGIDGNWAGLLVGEQFEVFHHLERVEDGDRKTLSGGAHTVPGAPDTSSFEVTSGPYSTSEAGGGGDFEIPSGFDAGTFRVLTHIHFTDPGKEPIVTGFHDLIVMVA